MRRSTLLTVALTALVVLAGCSGAGGTAGTNDAENAGDKRTVQVDAAGQLQAEADQVIVRVAVEATAGDAATARQRLAENASQMRSALKELGLGDDQITTVRYDIDQRRQHPRERGDERPEEYRARHTFELTLSDINRTGTVIDTAVTNGATGVDRVQFTLSPEKRQQLNHEALTEAMGNARDKADVLADSSNLSIIGVHTVSTTRMGVHPSHESAALTASGDGGGTDINSGPVTVTARVSVAYNATPT